MKESRNIEIKRKKEFGLYIIEASLYAMATAEGKIENEEVINDRLVLIKDKLKREMQINRISIKGLDDIKEIDELPIYKKITIYLNPYYELEKVKNLEPFPISVENREGLNWLNNFEAYLAINYLYYKEFKKPLKGKKIPQFTQTDIMEAKEILIDYYDLENPKSNPLEKDHNLLYYHPKPGIIKQAEEDVLTYELALLAKALTKDVIDITADTGFSEEKISRLLKILMDRSEPTLAAKAKKALQQQNK